MPGFIHEHIKDLSMKNAIELLSFLEFEVAEITTDLNNDQTETKPQQLLPDAVVLVTQPVRHAFVIEVQRQLGSKDRVRKQFSWPHYAMAARTRYQCPADVVVIALSRSVERFASLPIAIGAVQTWSPIVIGPSVLPECPTEEFATRYPTLALLAMLGHGKKHRTTQHALGVLEGWKNSAVFPNLDDQERSVYIDWVVRALPQHLRAQLQVEDMQRQYVPKMPITRLIMRMMNEGREEGLEQGLEEGRERGREEGRERGLEEGREEGREQGLRLAIRQILAAREIELSEAAEVTLTSCHDVEQLQTWVKKAVVAQHLEQVFGPPD